MTTDTSMANTFIYIRDNSDTTKPSNHATIRYDQFVRRLFKAMPERDMKFHAILGIAGESGELVDVVKRELIYNSKTTPEGKSIRDAIIEEAGDMRFFLQTLQQLYEISEIEILQANADKLSKRYKELTYSDNAANARADKQEGQ